jgi:hypothetical protein
MNYEVTINGKTYIASKQRSKERSWGNGVQYHVLFRDPKAKRKVAFTIHNAILETTGQIGGSNSFGPFGSPATFGKVYDIKGWGRSTYVGQREFQYLADKITVE